MFDRVQRVLKGKTNTRTLRHDFLFRRLFTCKGCGYSPIGERQKGHVYYRCHTKDCPTTCLRESVIEETVLATLTPLQFSDAERAYLRHKVTQLKQDWETRRESVATALRLRRRQLADRLARLTDAYLDGTVEKDLFEERKAALLMERQGIEEQLANLEDAVRAIPERLAEFLELAGSTYSMYKTALPEEKRELLEIVTSNRQVDGKNVELTLSVPFNEVANRFQNLNGAPQRDIPRTWDELLPKLWKWVETNPMSLTPTYAGSTDDDSDLT